MTNILAKFAFLVALAGLLALAVGIAASDKSLWQPGAVLFCFSTALWIGTHSELRNYQFTIWIVAVVVGAMIYPDRFLSIGDLDLRNRWVVLIVVQLVMFGMGTQMSLRDFAGVLKMPHGVLVGVFLQFLVMPLTGFALATAFGFPPEIAAGVVLIGSCSSGLASNVMCYMARANVALSITLTAIATLMAPLMTPLWMKLLAGQFVEVHFFDMMLQIFKIIVIPVGAAMLHDYLKFAPEHVQRKLMWVADVGVLFIVCSLVGLWHSLALLLGVSAQGYVTLQVAIELVAFLFAAVMVAHAYHWAVNRYPRLNGRMPLLSMMGIVYFTAVTTAAGRDNLLHIGLALFAAAILHNLAGYTFGYWLSRLLGLDKTSARTVAFEVGMQNGGMASGLAGAMGKLGTLGLAAAVFSPWMSISGSILANYWCKRPPNDLN